LWEVPPCSLGVNEATDILISMRGRSAVASIPVAV
jgi:hypothetical protein